MLVSTALADLTKKKIMKRSKSAKFVSMTKDIFSDNVHIVNPIDLAIINGKIQSYTSLEEFCVDLQWITHNCLVLYGGQFNFYKK